MECLYPILVKPHEWSVPQRVPCGQCIACRLNRSSSWAVRIMHELKMHDGIGCFVTFTYDQENAPWVSDDRTTLYYPDIQDFNRNLRRLIKPFTFKFFCAGEYGETTKRAHYHVIYFGIPKEVAENIFPLLWGKGHIHVGDVTYDSANYVAKYCTKKLTGDKAKVYEELHIVPEFSRMSRRPGIGATWIKKYAKQIKQHHSIVVKGKEVPVPRYYKDKCYERDDKLRDLRDSADYFVKKKEQLTKDMESGRLDLDRIETREITLLRNLKKRGG